MPDICNVGKLTTGHDACPPVRTITGTSTLDVNGADACLVGDLCEPHECPDHGLHNPQISQGSSLMDVDGIPVARVGDLVADGGCTSAHRIAEGDPLIEIDA